MKQNVYDDAEFFARYSGMRRSVAGLNGAEEWTVFRTILPDLRDKCVLDLGCGFGWHCRYAREQHARRIVGVDLSERILARARALTADPAIEYRRVAIEDIDFPPGAFDVAISSLALHYTQSFDLVCEKVHHCLTAGGAFVFSVEHPVFTALPSQEWYLGPAGERLHWPLDNYAEEGPRHTQWLAGDVVKYHRTVAAYVNGLIHAGFRVCNMYESASPPERLVERPELKDERRRPIFLLIGAVKPESRTSGEAR